MAANEEEIYSIMFTSLKHPVRRKILRILHDKPLTFKELGDLIGVSSSHLTYHLESLGELIYKMDNGKYKLSTFGKATVSAMKGVEEAPDVEAKRRVKLAPKWKTIFAALMVVVLVLSVFAGFQYSTLTQLAATQESLAAENQQLLSWGIGTSKVADALHNVAQIDTNKYKITLLSNTLEYRTDFDVAEEVIKYSLTSQSSPDSSMDATFRFRGSHLSRYQLTSIENTPLLTQTPPPSILETARAALNRYKAYSSDSYLDEMSNLLSAINQTQDLAVTQGNMKLQITNWGDSTEFLWMYTQNGIDFNAKSLRMTFENRILVALTDGYFLFTIANTNLDVSQSEAVTIARNHIKTVTWNIDGTQVSGFNTQETPVSVELLPHPRSDSVALVPYWYVVLRLDQTYSGGINEAAVGIFADTGEVADVHLLSG
jgi:DNA-binding transcriptional ArsR family regulator